MRQTLGETGAALMELSSATKHIELDMGDLAKAYQEASSEAHEQEKAADKLVAYYAHLKDVLADTSGGVVKLGDSSEDLIHKLLDGEMSAKEFGDAMQQDVLRALEEARRSGALTAAQMAELARAIRSIPREWTTTVTTEYRQVGTPPGSHHSGGLIMHSGGLADWAMRAGLISWHGGAQRRHLDGTAPTWPHLAWDEVPAILQKGEYVIRRSSVTPETLPILERLNRLGRGALTAPAAAPAPVIQVTAPVYLQGDLVGEEAILERVRTAAQAAAERGVLEALERRQGAGERRQGLSRMGAPI